MNSIKKITALTAPVIASYVLAGSALLLVLKAGLLVSLFSGLLVYSLVHVLTPTIEKKFNNRQARMIAMRRNSVA